MVQNGPDVSEACAVGKVYVACFMNDPVSKECNTASTTAAPGTVSELSTTKSTPVAPPSRSTASADASGATNTDLSKFVTPLGVPDPSEQGQGGTNIITIIAASVVGGFMLSLLVTTTVMLIVIIRLWGCKSHLNKHKPSHIRVHETESVDTNGSPLYSDRKDVPIIEQSQQAIPIYETIMTNSELNETGKSTTNTYPVEVKDSTTYYESSSNVTTRANEAYGASTCQVDLIENIAYESSSKVTTRANEAYGASTCSMDLKENVAYESSSKVTTRANEAYGASTCPVDLKENIAYESSSKVTTRANEAYGASTCPVDLKENIAYESSCNIKKITIQTTEIC